MLARFFILLFFCSIQPAISKTFEIIEYTYALNVDLNKYYFKAIDYYYLGEENQYCIIEKDSKYKAYKIELQNQAIELPDFYKKIEYQEDAIDDNSIVRIKNLSTTHHPAFLLFDWNNERQKMWYEQLKSATRTEIPITQEMIQRYETFILEAKSIDKPLLPPPPEKPSIRFISNE